ncbi:MAG: diguanylate cyclase, partial [Bacteroidia bacterium]
MADCEDCNYTDPYSYIVSVILPVWQGRFSNIAFRNYFERLLRTEAPAHVLLNICWVGYQDMALFESVWKWWLMISNSPNSTAAERTNAQRGLVTVLKSIRSRYPSGTLHDCDTDDTLQNSVILNNSNLGTL